MLNVVAIMGRLAADPQLRQTTTGKNVASFRIACDRGRRDANGQSQADWLDVVAWDRTAEFVCKYFQKGSLIAIDGRLQSRQYQDKNGNNRTAIEIVANNVNFAAPKSANAAPMGDAGYGAPMAAPAARPAVQANPAPSYSAGSNDDFALIEDEATCRSKIESIILTRRFPQWLWIVLLVRCIVAARRFAPSALTALITLITRICPACAST